MPSASENKPTVKQQREARRAEKVAQLKKKQAAEKRKQRIGIGIAAGAAVVAVGLVVTFVVTNATPPVDRDTIDIADAQTFDGIAANHVQGVVDYEAEYEMNPPAGGNHNQVWLNCGVYEEPQQNENAVHSLEHGAVWVTYDPEALSDDEVETLRDAVPSTYAIVSPYEGLPSAVAVSAWGAQVQVDSVDDERIEQFIQKYWKSPDVPEPGAACTGALDGPGKLS